MPIGKQEATNGDDSDTWPAWDSQALYRPFQLHRVSRSRRRRFPNLPSQLRRLRFGSLGFDWREFQTGVAEIKTGRVADRKRSGPNQVRFAGLGGTLGG